jgi:hypothetical protein
MSYLSRFYLLKFVLPMLCLPPLHGCIHCGHLLCSLHALCGPNAHSMSNFYSPILFNEPMLVYYTQLLIALAIFFSLYVRYHTEHEMAYGIIFSPLLSQFLLGNKHVFILSHNLYFLKEKSH